jgi:flagellar hook-basal body complex protein FliE
MSMPILPASSGVTGIAGIAGIEGLAGAAGSSAAGGASGAPFAQAMTSGLDSVSSLERAADTAVASFAAGGSVQITDVMAATSKANLGVTIVNEIRNRGLEAYQSILNVQV